MTVSPITLDETSLSPNPLISLLICSISVSKSSSLTGLFSKEREIPSLSLISSKGTLDLSYLTILGISSSASSKVVHLSLHLLHSLRLLIWLLSATSLESITLLSSYEQKGHFMD